jgi:hypothetical protein
MVRKVPNDYPPVIGNGLLKEAQFEGPRRSIAEQIERRNRITAEQIDDIIFRWVYNPFFH